MREREPSRLRSERTWRGPVIGSGGLWIEPEPGGGTHGRSGGWFGGWLGAWFGAWLVLLVGAFELR